MAFSVNRSFDNPLVVDGLIQTEISLVEQRNFYPVHFHENQHVHDMEYLDFDRVSGQRFWQVVRRYCVHFRIIFSESASHAEDCTETGLERSADMFRCRGYVSGFVEILVLQEVCDENA